MARHGEVIPSRHWRHSSGATASPYGAVPWTGAPGDREEDWRLENVGWTIAWDDGTVGIGRLPFPTQVEAQDWLDREHARLAAARSRLSPQWSPPKRTRGHRARESAGHHIAPGYPAERFRIGQDVAMISNPAVVGHVVGFDPDGSVMVQWHGGRAVSGVDARNLRGLPPGYAGQRMRAARPYGGAQEPSRRRHVRETDDDAKFSMTYGQLPPFERFVQDVRRPDPDHPGKAYWPKGEMYSMELVTPPEIELAEAFGLKEFRAERARTGRNTNVRGFRDNEKAIYEFLEYLSERWDNGDDFAGDLASGIMTSLGYEWI